jgi:hypothetical protein
MKERFIHSNIMVPADNQPAIIAQPRKRPLYFIATFIASHFTTIIVLLFLIVTAIRTYQFDTFLSQPFSKRIAVIAFIGDQPKGISFGTASARTRYGNIAYRFFEQRDFARGCTVQVVSQRNTLAVDHHHPLRSLAAFGLSDTFAPFLAGAKLPSAKASDQSSCPFLSSWARKARQASSQISCSSQSRSRLQQVEGLEYCFGKSAQGAPVRNIQRIPSNTLRLSAQGLPPRLEVLCFGNNGSIFCHWTSVSFQRCLVILDSLKKTSESSVHKSLQGARLNY